MNKIVSTLINLVAIIVAVVATVALYPWLKRIFPHNYLLMCIVTLLLLFLLVICLLYWIFSKVFSCKVKEYRGNISSIESIPYENFARLKITSEDGKVFKAVINAKEAKFLRFGDEVEVKVSKRFGETVNVEVKPVVSLQDMSNEELMEYANRYGEEADVVLGRFVDRLTDISFDRHKRY